MHVRCQSCCVFPEKNNFRSMIFDKTKKQKHASQHWWSRELACLVLEKKKTDANINAALYSHQTALFSLGYVALTRKSFSRFSVYIERPLKRMNIRGGRPLFFYRALFLAEKVFLTVATVSTNLARGRALYANTPSPKNSLWDSSRLRIGKIAAHEYISRQRQPWKGVSIGFPRYETWITLSWNCHKVTLYFGHNIQIDVSHFSANT